LELAKVDLNYHKNFEEFNKTTEALNDIYKNRRNQLNEAYELKKTYLIDLKAKNDEYARSQYEVSCQPLFALIRSDLYVRRPWRKRKSRSKRELWRRSTTSIDSGQTQAP
jgi:hypothetical protein